MIVKNYKRLAEQVITTLLDNGLTVHLLPKNNYHKTIGVLYTDFGSIDTKFIPKGHTDLKSYPPGIAHFLEHTLFIKEKGDVSQEFSKLGASANAFTSYSKTAYQFSTTEHVRENVTTLLDFVQQPYFTKESVEKEKGIISQEIHLYKDDPDWTLMLGLIGNLYPTHPVSDDIAGTEDSIEKITPELLYEVYDHFYQPGNMTLLLVGKLDAKELIGLIEENQLSKSSVPSQRLLRKEGADNLETIIPYKKISMQISKPKALVGIRGNKYNLRGEERLRHLILMDLLLNMLFGDTSSTYLAMYDEGLIDDSFQFNYTFERRFDYISLGGDTSEPERLVDAIKTICFNYEWNPDINAEHFSIIKKSLIGQALLSMNSLEFLADQFVEHDFEAVSFYDTIDILESVSLEEVKSLAASYFLSSNSSFYIIDTE